MDWDDVAEGWDDDPAVRTYAAGVWRSLLDLASQQDFPLEGARACDFGCGTGALTERLAERCAHVDAIDASDRMLGVLRAKVVHEGWAHIDTWSELPEDRGPFDLVVCSSVCAFLEDYPATVRRLVSRIAPGGLFVQWDWEIDAAADDPHGLSRDEIRQALDDAGLRDVAVDIGFSVPFEDQTMAPLMGSGRR